MNDEQKKLMLDRLQIGASYQILLLFIEQAFILEKEESIKSLNELFKSFVESLSDEEKKEFGKKMMTMLDEKTDAMQAQLEEELPADELESVQDELQRIAAADKV